MRGLRRRILWVALLSSGTALLTVLLLVGPPIRRQAEEHITETLLAEAHLMARVVEEPLARGAAAEELDVLVDAAARDVKARVTIVAVGGRVVADSERSGAALLALDNHWERPEIQQARASGRGTATRYSDTVGEDLLYAAVAVRRGPELVGIARVALPLHGVSAQVREFHSAVAAALVAAFVVTAVLSAALSRPLAGPLREIMDTARRLAAGQLDARITVHRPDELGELSAMLNRAADQIQARHAELVRDRARSEAFLAAMAEGALAVDHQGTVLLANDLLRGTLLLDDPVGRHYIEVVRQREVGEVIESVLRTGERRQQEVQLRHVGRIHALTGVPFPGGQGLPSGAFLTFHDITELRRLEQIRKDFVANASHELRTPLTSIRGFVEALEDGAIQQPDTAQRFLAKIRTHADRMAGLIEDLLELSRLEAGERPARRDVVAPAEVAAEVAASFAELAERRGLRLECTDLGAPAVVADEDRLRRILESLLDNALKYTPPGGRVRVSSGAAAAAGAFVEVQDDGPGIAAEHLPRIFERFYRVDRARSRELGGTGLGLSIVKHLADSIGARVEVASEPGRGTRFTVHLRHEAPLRSSAG
jgi:two-component system phosphate regulon sensor histidine kinase PhoR